ncbi:MAG TPA: glycosyltransferase [Polyangiaceae bacterium]
MTVDDRGQMRILLVTADTSFADDRSECLVADLVRGLPPAGLDVALACPESSLTQVASAAGVRIFPIELASGLATTRASALRRIIAGFKPDIVHAHGPRAAMVARLADSRARRRVVYTVRDLHVHHVAPRAKRAAFLRVEHRLRARTAAWVCECGSDCDLAERLKILRRERSHVVYKGVELPQLPSSGVRHAVDVPLVLSIGVFNEQKDQRTLLDAWASARSSAPDAVLTLVGSGEFEPRLRERVFALGIGDSVRFLAPRPDVASLYAEAELFVLSSRWEGLPYVLLQAMAHNLPVVSTAIDGIPELVINEDTGLLVPAHDPGSLAWAMRELLTDPDRRRAMGEAGRIRIERHFTLDEMIESTIRVYGEVLSAGEARD